jgi:hypothetical protein
MYGSLWISFLQIPRTAEMNLLRIRPSYRRTGSGKWILKLKHIMDVKFSLSLTSKFDQVFAVPMGKQTTEFWRILPWASFVTWEISCYVYMCQFATRRICEQASSTMKIFKNKERSWLEMKISKILFSFLARTYWIPDIHWLTASRYPKIEF